MWCYGMDSPTLYIATQQHSEDHPTYISTGFRCVVHDSDDTPPPGLCECRCACTGDGVTFVCPHVTIWDVDSMRDMALLVPGGGLR